MNISDTKFLLEESLENELDSDDKFTCARSCLLVPECC